MVSLYVGDGSRHFGNVSTVSVIVSAILDMASALLEMVSAISEMVFFMSELVTAISQMAVSAVLDFPPPFRRWFSRHPSYPTTPLPR
jgi:hypothetical protein